MNRLRRSCLVVPGSEPRMLGKAATLPADEVILDLEDAVAPEAKAPARANVVAALTEQDWGNRIRAVRVNGWNSDSTVEDLVEIVAAGPDCVVLPKVNAVAQVQAADRVLSQLERRHGRPEGRIGLEVQIEDPAGLAVAGALAALPRVETLIFGPLDFAAAMGIPRLTDSAYESILLQIVLAARACGKQAIDGPVPAFRDVDAITRSASRSAAIGCDGKWVIHPDQIAPANSAFIPTQEEFDRAEALIEAYTRERGAAVFAGEMIDEASYRIALAVRARGRAARLC
ncbi:MAG TPA: CoA ester lyase [Mycobacteriales bacterium]|nr:CoA ester lyase [Mycobacteriales bacterium]